MTGSATAFLPSPHDPGAPSRLRLALAASAASHLFFAQALTPEMPHRGALAVGVLPITARIEPMPVLAPGGPAAIEIEEPAAPRQPKERPAAVDAGVHAARQKNAPAATPPPLPLIPDPTIYSARDLDSYPRLLVPLDTGRIGNAEAGNTPVVVRLEVTIDERGIVNDIAIVGPGPAATVEKELSALLAAAGFIPARKDGRAVKSRVLLSIVLAARNADR